MGKRRRPEQQSMLKLMGFKPVKERPFHGHLLVREDDKPQLQVTTIGPDCPEGPTVMDLDDEAFEDFVNSNSVGTANE